MTTAMDSDKKKNIWKKTAAAALIVAAVTLLLFAACRRLDMDGYLLPAWTKPYQRDAAACGPGRAFWETRTVQDDIRIELSRKKVTVTGSEDLHWTSPDGVLVQDVLYEDIDRDGERELILLCWRRGSYGEHMPFWVEKNDNDWGQHIFIYDYLRDNTVYPSKVHPIWMSSAIPMNIIGFSFDERNQAIYITQDGGTISGWAWLSWGLELISEQSEVSFLCAGDLLIHGPIYGRALADGSFDFLFDIARFDPELTKRFQKTDIAAIGAESPLVTDSPLFGSYPSFGTPAFLAEAVGNAGFDLAVCATNHALDRGMNGIDTTLSAYGNAGVRAIGTQGSGDQSAYRPYEIINREGIRFALLSYTYGINGLSLPEESPYAVHLLPEEEELRADLALARADADCVLVFVHWGTEYASEPDEMQQAYTKIFLEEGVDVVIGTHPHVVQPYEVLTAEGRGSAAGSGTHRMLVYYSLGNFISANADPAQNSGALASFTIKKDGDHIEITDPELIPIETICD